MTDTTGTPVKATPGDLTIVPELNFNFRYTGRLGKFVQWLHYKKFFDIELEPIPLLDMFKFSGSNLLAKIDEDIKKDPEGMRKKLAEQMRRENDSPRQA